jgi:excisionase family DNA binding protein
MRRTLIDFELRRLGVTSTDEADNLPLDQIPAVIGQLAALQCRLAAKLLDGHDDRPSSPDTSSEQLLSMKEVAGQLGVPVAYARELGRRGELPVVHVGPKYVRVRQSVLDAWIAQREDR